MPKLTPAQRAANLREVRRMALGLARRTLRKARRETSPVYRIELISIAAGYRRIARECNAR